MYLHHNRPTYKIDQSKKSPEANIQEPSSNRFNIEPKSSIRIQNNHIGPTTSSIKNHNGDLQLYDESHLDVYQQNELRRTQLCKQRRSNSFLVDDKRRGSMNSNSNCSEDDDYEYDDDPEGGGSTRKKVGGNQGRRSGRRRYGRLFCQCFERDRWRFCFHITYECTKLAIRQRSTLFVLLLILDFMFNTIMFYYEYVYIMVDVDVRHVDGSSPFHHLLSNYQPPEPDKTTIKPHLSSTTTTPETFTNATITSNVTKDNNVISSETTTPTTTTTTTTTTPTTQKPTTSTATTTQKQSSGGGRKHQSKADLDGQNSISFTDQSGQQVDTRSYQYEINLIVYILIYVSEINGFYAYLWSKHGWLTLYLTIVCIQLVFLLFLLFVNLHLIIVYLFRLMLFFMSLHKSLSISDYQMIIQQRKSYEYNSNNIPRVEVVTPNGGNSNSADGDYDGTGIGSDDDPSRKFRTRTQMRKRMSDTSYSESSWPNHHTHHRHHHTSAVTVSNQDGQEVGIITLSSELESHDRGPLITTTTTTINYTPSNQNLRLPADENGKKFSQRPILNHHQRSDPNTSALCRVLPSVRKASIIPGVYPEPEPKPIKMGQDEPLKNNITSTNTSPPQILPIKRTSQERLKKFW